MKRTCFMFLLLSLLLWSSCAHTPLDQKETSSDGISGDSVVSSNAKSDILLPSADKSEKTSPSSLRVMTPSQTTVDKGDGFYRYTSDGRCNGFSLRDDKRPLSTPAEARLSEEELRRRGEAYLHDKVPLSQYQFLNAKDMPYNNCIAFIYTREIKGYPSFDEVSVDIAYDGTIVDFYAPRVGIFDSIDETTIPGINEAELLKKLDVLMKQQFGDMSYAEFPEKRTLFMMEDGSFAMYMVALPDGMDETYTWSFYVPIE